MPEPDGLAAVTKRRNRRSWRPGEAAEELKPENCESGAGYRAGAQLTYANGRADSGSLLNGGSWHRGPGSDADQIGSPSRSYPHEIDWAAHDWPDLLPRLKAVAVRRLWRQRGSLPSAEDADDLVNEALTKTFEGIRMWNPEKCTLFQHLAGVIKSLVSHSFSSSDGKLIVRDLSSSGFPDEWPPELMDEAPNPEQVQESQSTLQDLLEHLDQKDPMMRKMAELNMRGIDATQDLSRELDLPPAEVANLRRRMTRAARAYGLEQQP